MNKTFKNIIVFAIGFVSGCFVTKKYLENKQVEVIYEEEPENVVEDINDDDDNDIIKDDSNNVGEYHNILTRENYVTQQEEMWSHFEKGLEDGTVTIEPTGNYDLEDDDYEVPTSRYDTKGNEMEEYTVSADRPYNIPFEEFEVYDGYDSAEMTYYADGYVCDSEGYPLSPDDVIDLIGEDFPSWFGSYDEDQIWVRNDRLQMDFSVIKVLAKFSEEAPPRLRRMAGIYGC